MAINRLVQQGKVQVYADTMFNAANDAGGADGVVAVRNQMAELRHLIYSDMDLSLALNAKTPLCVERAVMDIVEL